MLVGLGVHLDDLAELALYDLLQRLLGDRRDDPVALEDVLMVESLLVLVIDKLLPEEFGLVHQDIAGPTFTNLPLNQEHNTLTPLGALFQRSLPLFNVLHLHFIQEMVDLDLCQFAQGLVLLDRPEMVVTEQQLI